MAGTILGVAAAAAAAAIALAGHVGGTHPAAGTVSPFGGPVPVHIARVGHIEVDLEAPAPARLRRVGCAGPSGPGTACFVAR